MEDLHCRWFFGTYHEVPPLVNFHDAEDEDSIRKLLHVIELAMAEAKEQEKIW